MSMPSFPPNGADMTREEALTMIIASIAMEELALSHILNAEGEKLQYILGTLPGAKLCAGPQDVLAVNKSVTALVEAVTQNQMLLKNKLERVLDACPPPWKPGRPCEESCPPPWKPGRPCEESCPPPWKPGRPCDDPCPPSWKPGPPCVEPCPPCEPGPHPPLGGARREKSALQLTGQREGLLWNQGCRLPWRQRVRQGGDIQLDEPCPTQIRLNLKKAYMVQYTLNVCAMHPAEEAGTILLKQTPCGAFTETLPLRFSIERDQGCSQTLRYAAVLHPRMDRGSEAEISLALDAKSALCVERAVMDVVEL